MKTEIYNLIILDESGSMSDVTRQTIDGCNETINTIIASQEQFSETQDHFISIYAFQSNPRVPSRYIVKNIPAKEAKHITDKDYEPWGSTPLYDAIGSTLVDLKMLTSEKTFAIGSVTIITDGYENASTNYDHGKVSKMIEALKEMGWNFNFIGANIDVCRTARSLNIDNMMEFKNDAEGTKAMFERERSARIAYNSRINKEMQIFACEDPDASPSVSRESLSARMKRAAKNYFKEDDEA